MAHIWTIKGKALTSYTTTTTLLSIGLMALSSTTNIVEQYNSCLECSKTCSQNADFTRVLAIAHRSMRFSAYQVEEIFGKSFSDGSTNEGEERERERERGESEPRR